MANQPSRETAGRIGARRAAGDAVVVTGAGGGIGLAIVGRLLGDGWAVVATDVDQAGLERVRRAVAGERSLRLSAMNVAERTSVTATAAALRADGLRVAGLVNVAGLLQDVFPLFSMDDVLQQRIWDVNYFGAVTCTQVFGAVMADGLGGAIVNITSINELRPLPLHAYAPTKVALGALTVLSAGELGPKGVRVNAVAPGFTLTPIMEDKIRTGKRDVTTLRANAAMGRLVETGEVASVVSFLLSDDASAVTGVSIPVDAGWLATSHWMNFRDLGQGPE
jgi:NAD(P)-dependent dehydrogenase (short-subunit alcohol dehydrogenase family)